MTKKLNPLEDPPTASSSDDDEVETSAGEEEEEGEEEDSSSEEEDEPNVPAKAPSSAAVTIAVPGKTTVSSSAAAAKQASDSGSGSETETDSDSETNHPPNQGSGKAVTAAKPKKKEEAHQPLTLALPAAKSGTKRPSEGASKETNNSKRAKKVTSGDDEKKVGEDSRKPAFQRLWTEEDEIAILQGMIDFKAETGKSPYEDTNSYYDFIKKSISFEVSKNQFMDKLRSLRKKYMGKEKPSFTKPHDQKSYKLCNYIWGPEGICLESAVKSNGVSKKSQKSKKLDSVKQELSFSPNGKAVEEDHRVSVHGGGDLEPAKKPDWFENSFLVRSIAGFGVDEHSVKRSWTLVPVEAKKKIEEKLKMLQAKEIEFVLEKTEFLHQVTSMIAEASKNKAVDK